MAREAFRAGVAMLVAAAHPSVRHNQILNGASVISSPFIGVELTSWKAQTLPQVTAVFDPEVTPAG